MLTEQPAVETHPELLRPERKQPGETIDTRIVATATPTIMPAIDQTQRLCMPVPIAAWMYRAVHRALHLIEIRDLVIERLNIDAANMWIKRTQQDWNLWSHSMHSLF